MAYTSRDNLKNKRTYVTAVNGATKTGAQCITIYDLTPTQVIAILEREVRKLPRKAG